MNDTNRFYISVIIWTLFILLTCFSGSAEAYIGPGAGIAFFSSFLIFLVTFLLALALFLFWPIRLIMLRFKKRKIRHTLMRTGPVKTHRAIIIGLDGMDPELAKEFMDKGLLPNFCKLMELGTFLPLETTCPPISPVAWSSFSTGTNPARHGIYDFFTRCEELFTKTLLCVYWKTSSCHKLWQISYPFGKT